MEKQILVPIDYSEGSREVVKIAVKWAYRTNKVLHFLNVEPSYLKENGPGQATLLNRFDFYLKQFKLTSKYQRSLRFGVPYLEIIELARTITSELIVMTAHSHTLLDRLYLRSNTDYVVHHSNCPVYAHKQQSTKLENKIIVPIDYTEINKSVIRLADARAQGIGAELYFIHTEPAPKYFPNQYAFKSGFYQGRYELTMDEIVRRDRDSRIANLQRTFEEYIDSLEVKSRYQSIFELGKPYIAIKALQQRIKAGLIMMATGSHTFLNRLLAGSNTDYLMHHLNCPIYIYKEKM